MSYNAADSKVSDGGNPTKATTRKKTQEDQDKEDDKTREDAEQKLEQSWMDRLQLISVITTFFVAIESQLLAITTPPGGSSNKAAEIATNAVLSGALVLHSFAAAFSFVAVFVLIHFRLKEAKEEENIPGSSEENQKISARNPHVALEYGLQPGRRPLPLLQRFHTLCILLATTGFILATTGILCFVWSQQARSVGIFSSIAFAVSVVGGVVVLLMPSPAKED